MVGMTDSVMIIDTVVISSRRTIYVTVCVMYISEHNVVRIFCFAVLLYRIYWNIERTAQFFFCILHIDAAGKAMKVRVSKQGNLLNLKVKLGFKESLDDERCDHIASVYLPGFFKLYQIKGHQLLYRGNTGTQLADRLTKKLTEYDFYLIVEQIVVATERLAEHDLPQQYLVLDTNKIYINENTKELQFLYVPVKETNSTGVLEFIASLVYLIKPAEGNTEYLTKFAYFLKSMSSYSPRLIEDYISRKDSSIVQMLSFKKDRKKMNFTEPDVKNDSESDDKTEQMEDEPTMLLAEMDEPTEYLDEPTDYLPDNEETEMIRYPTLERVSQGEVIQIDRAVFRIGKDFNSVDYTLRNNNAISGNHIDVITRGEHYFVVDLNSKNKTYINGRRIPPQCENEIFDGDSLRLANEDFVFHTYD